MVHYKPIKEGYKMDENYLSNQQTAEFFKIHVATLKRWRADKTMNFPEPVMIGRRKIFFKRDELTKWINSNKNKV